jgi:ubiquinone/menaquinone biosynthesis C-methylase UbiE
MIYANNGDSAHDMMTDDFSVAPHMQEAIRTGRIAREWDYRASQNPYHYVDATKRNWNKAEFYAKGLRLVEQIVDPMLDHLKIDPAGKRVLEIGCGIGRLFEGLSQRFAEVYGIDVSSQMLEYGKANCPVQAVWIHGDGLSLTGIDSETIDYVISYEVIQHIPSKTIIEKYIRESYRVLKQGGGMQLHMRRGSDSLRQAAVRQLPKPLRQLAASVANKMNAIEFMGDIDTWLGTTLKPSVAVELASSVGFEIIEILPDIIHHRNSGYWLVCVKPSRTNSLSRK